MNIADIAFALTAGVFASLSPCSFPLLPGYMSYYIGTNPSLTKTIPSITSCSLGLILTLSTIGVGLSLIGSILYHFIPFLPLIAGALIVVMALLMISKVNIKIPLRPLTISKRKGMMGMFIYGAIYGLTASSCSAPVFLSIILYAFALGPFYGIVAFIIYSIGMSLPIAIATLLASKAKTFILKRFTKSMDKVQKIGAAILLLVGLYLIMEALL